MEDRCDDRVRLVGIGRCPSSVVSHGIVVTMYAADHDPPHFHVRYGDHKAQVRVADCWPLAGSLPTGAMRLLRRWHSLHADELALAWDKATRSEAPGTIEPLP